MTCVTRGNECGERSGNADRRNGANHKTSGGDCDRSSCLDVNTNMPNSRHKNVAAVCLDVNTCCCFRTVLGLIVQTPLAGWEGRSGSAPRC